MSKPEFDEIVIEVNCRRKIKQADTMSADGMNVIKGKEFIAGNDDVLFPPTASTLRSRFQVIRVRAMPSVQALQMPDWPGHKIHLSVEKRYARITDGLLDDPARLKQIRDVFLSMEQVVPSITPLLAMQPLPDAVYDVLSDEDIITWQYWMRRMLTEQGGTTMADPVQNCDKLPTAVELMMTGKVRKPFLDPMIRMTTEGDTPEKEFYSEKDAKLQQLAETAAANRRF